MKDQRNDITEEQLKLLRVSTDAKGSRILVVMMYVFVGLGILFAYSFTKYKINGDFGNSKWIYYIYALIPIVIWANIIIILPESQKKIFMLYMGVFSSYVSLMYMTLYYELIYKVLHFHSSTYILFPLFALVILVAYLVRVRLKNLRKTNIVVQKSPPYIKIIFLTALLSPFVRLIFSEFNNDTKTITIAFVALMLGFFFSIMAVASCTGFYLVIKYRKLVFKVQ